jgi:hypothetical protein
MGNKRAHIYFDDEEEIDLVSLVGNTEQPKPTVKQQKAVVKEAKKTGFVSREPKKMGRRRTSPYNAQFGGKCRGGMKLLFQEIGEALDCQDTVTLELAIQALLEKEGLDELLNKYNELTQ